MSLPKAADAGDTATSEVRPRGNNAPNRESLVVVVVVDVDARMNRRLSPRKTRICRPCGRREVP